MQQAGQAREMRAFGVMNQKLVPVLSISTNATGSHRTLFPVGTRADMLIHDYNVDGNPTYSEGVYVEMVTKAQADEVRASAPNGLSFSDSDQFNEWLCGPDDEEARKEIVAIEYDHGCTDNL